MTFSQWMSNSFWFGFNVQFGSSLKIVFHFGYFRGFRLLYKLTNFQNQTKLYNLTLAYIYCASIAQVTWPQMIQFWDVDLSAIHQKFLVNLPPKLEWYDLHSCSHEQKTKSLFVHHWDQISVNSVFVFSLFSEIT